MIEGAFLKWALTTHGTNVLILFLAYFILREKLDIRYQKKDNCPDDKCYEVFLTKVHHLEKEKRMDEMFGSIKEEMKKIKDLLLDLIRDNRK